MPRLLAGLQGSGAPSSIGLASAPAGESLEQFDQFGITECRRVRSLTLLSLRYRHRTVRPSMISRS